MLAKGDQIEVLDQGFVRLVDYMGDDMAIVQAARVSYGDGTKVGSPPANLINRLMADRHTSPFEMVKFKFHVRVPMDTWRQWIRHRMANVNEYSTRYSVAIDAMQKTKPDEWRLQSKDNKQGSSGFLVEWPADWEDKVARRLASNEVTPGDYLTARETQLQSLARAVYLERLSFGIAREQARKDLPLSTYTEAYWCIDLKNLLDFLRLRRAPDAQFEIRQYANALAQFVKAICPLTWEAYLQFSQNVMVFTEKEWDIMEDAIDKTKVEVCTKAIIDGYEPANPGAKAAKSLIKKLGLQETNPVDPAQIIVNGADGKPKFYENKGEIE